MQNAEQQACFLLRQTIASTLPPPGYSKARPHVWALSLPTGAVHLFQVGTPQIAEEFKTSANYWSARLSKEPLTGGVDNIEYGWSNNIINTALVGNSSPAQDAVAAGSAGGPRPSHDQSGTVRIKTAGDRAHVEDWKPPAQSMMASQLMAVDQLRGLKDYVHNVEKELSKHNDLRAPMDLAVSHDAMFLCMITSNMCSTLHVIRTTLKPWPTGRRNRHISCVRLLSSPPILTHSSLPRRAKRGMIRRWPSGPRCERSERPGRQRRQRRRLPLLRRPLRPSSQLRPTRMRL